MPLALVTLGAFVAMLAVCGVMAVWLGVDSRDGFAEQRRYAQRRRRQRWPGDRH